MAINVNLGGDLQPPVKPVDPSLRPPRRQRFSAGGNLRPMGVPAPPQIAVPPRVAALMDAARTRVSMPGEVPFWVRQLAHVLTQDGAVDADPTQFVSEVQKGIANPAYAAFMLEPMIREFKLNRGATVEDRTMARNQERETAEIDASIAQFDRDANIITPELGWDEIMRRRMRQRPPVDLLNPALLSWGPQRDLLQGVLRNNRSPESKDEYGPQPGDVPMEFSSPAMRAIMTAQRAGLGLSQDMADASAAAFKPVTDVGLELFGGAAVRALPREGREMLSRFVAAMPGAMVSTVPDTVGNYAKIINPGTSPEERTYAGIAFALNALDFIPSLGLIDDVGGAAVRAFSKSDVDNAVQALRQIDEEVAENVAKAVEGATDELVQEVATAQRAVEAPPVIPPPRGAEAMENIPGVTFRARGGQTPEPAPVAPPMIRQASEEVAQVADAPPAQALDLTAIPPRREATIRDVAARAADAPQVQELRSPAWPVAVVPERPIDGPAVKLVDAIAVANKAMGGVKLAQGKRFLKSSVGRYYTGAGTAFTQGVGDARTALHELGHRLWQAHPTLTSADLSRNPGALRGDAELLSPELTTAYLGEDVANRLAEYVQTGGAAAGARMSKPLSRAISSKGMQNIRLEALAEYTTAKSVQPDVRFGPAADAPTSVLDELWSELPAPQTKALMDLGTAVRNAASEGPLDQVAQAIRFANEPAEASSQGSSRYRQALTAGREGLIDDSVPIYNAVRQATEQLGFSPEHAYDITETARAWLGRVRYFDGKIKVQLDRMGIVSEAGEIPLMDKYFRGGDAVQMDLKRRRFMANAVANQVVDDAFVQRMEYDSLLAAYQDEVRRVLPGVPLDRPDLIRRAYDKAIRAGRISGELPENPGTWEDFYKPLNAGPIDVATGQSRTKMGYLEQAQKAVEEAASAPWGAEAEAFYQDYAAIARDILQMRHAEGLISDEAFEAMTQRRRHHVYLFRDMAARKEATEGFDPMVGGVGKSLTRKGLKFWKRQGSDLLVNDPLVNIIEAAHVTIQEVQMNQAKRAILDIFRTPQDYFQQADLGNLITYLGPDPAPGERVVGFYEGGQFQGFKVEDPLLWEAFSKLGSVDATDNAWFLALQQAVQIQKRAITNVYPFPVISLLRDIPDTAIKATTFQIPGADASLTRQLMDSYRIVIDSFKKVARQDPEIVRLYEEFGGGMTYHEVDYSPRSYNAFVAASIPLIRKNKMGLVVNDTNKLSKALNIMRTPARKYTAHLQHLERATRMAVFEKTYRQAQALGMDRERAGLFAGQASRDIVDWRRSGSVVRKLNPYIAFLNPRIQGLERTFSAMTKSPLASAGTTAKILMYASMGVATHETYLELTGTRDQYRSMPDWMRYSFWVFPIPGIEYPILIPKPFEFAVAANLMSDMQAKASGSDEFAFPDEAEEVGPYLTGLVGGSIPLRVDQMVSMGFPGIAEVIYNRSMVPSRQLVPEHELRRAPIERPGATQASPQGQFIAFDLLGGAVDPRHVDHILRSQFGYYQKHSSSVIEAARGEEPWQHLWADLSGITRAVSGRGGRDTVIVSDMIRAEGAASSRDVEWYYELRDMADDAAITGEQRAQHRAQLAEVSYRARGEIEIALEELKTTDRYRESDPQERPRLRSDAVRRAMKLLGREFRAQAPAN